MAIKIKRITLYVTKMEMKNAVQASYGTHKERESIIVEMEDINGVRGFGEVVAFAEPWYTEETIQTAYHIIKDFLAPMLFQGTIYHPHDVAALFSVVKRNNMAKAGLEGAVWDIYAQIQQLPLAKAIGGEREKIPVGVVVGINQPSIMLQQIAAYVEAGYERVKIKISPANDRDVIEVIRKEFPYLPLMADANGSYDLHHLEQLKNLDQYHLLMIEQPFGERAFLEHATLQKELSTPICLDESIDSLEDVTLALALGSCKVVNIKSGRVGGLTNAIAIHNYCRARHVPVWCGGMYETGIGRAQNIALATLPNFTIPGDISASAKYWEEDVIIPEIVLEKGCVRVPTAKGIGFHINSKRLEEVASYKETYHSFAFSSI